MKHLILSALVLATLAGCETNPARPTAEVRIAERVEYVVRIPPEELITPPPTPATIDIDKATQSDVARWLLVNETYIKELKNKFILIAKFLKNEQDKLNAEAITKNTAAGTASTPNMIATLPPLKPLAPLAPLAVPGAPSAPSK